MNLVHIYEINTPLRLKNTKCIEKLQSSLASPMPQN